jgi:hypothetical protein
VEKGGGGWQKHIEEGGGGPRRRGGSGFDRDPSRVRESVWRERVRRGAGTDIFQTFSAANKKIKSPKFILCSAVMVG